MGCLVQIELEMDKCYAWYSVLKYRVNSFPLRAMICNYALTSPV